MTARRSRLRTDDSGVSLVELLVAGLVAGIVLSAVGVMFTGSLQASRQASAHVTVTADARLAMDVVERRLRVAARPSAGASALTEATPSSLTFFAHLGGGATPASAVSRVRYAVDPARGCLLETVTPPVGSPVGTCLARGDVTLLFDYHRVAKRPTLDHPSPTPVPTGAMAVGPAGLGAAELALVGAVELQVTVGRAAEQGTGRPVSLRSRVLLVNLHNEETP